MAKSKKFQLNIFDFIKGLFLAVGIPLGYYLLELLPSLNLEAWQKIAISAFVNYIIKNFVENNRGQLFAKDEDTGDNGGGAVTPTKGF